VKGTDKNLGVSVVTLEWYTLKCLDHLTSDVFSELKTRDDIPYQVFRNLARDIIRMANWNKQETTFLKDAFSLTDVPKFHGIPKIHKKPWGLRPIVPSHSWVSSPAAKIVSKYLKPLYKHYSWIIQSTREFVEKIKTVTIKPHKRLFMCTGDVAAMYTNIDKDKARITLESMLKYQKYSDAKVKALLHAIDLANNYNYVEFDGRYFHQRKGLAMGTACSPDIANLFVGNRERAAGYLKQEGMVLYVRYIDDIFAIVEANSEEDALRRCPKNIGSLRLSWEVSDTKIHFLDVEVYKLPGEGALRYRPYRKPLNHYSRIPWSSSHPKHVKKSVLGGELARLAVNSSHRENYYQAAQEFRDALRLRGWPIDILRAWFKELLEKRWRVKDAEKDPAPDYLVLKTKYNPIWDGVKIQPIHDAMIKYWGSFQTTARKAIVHKVRPDGSYEQMTTTVDATSAAQILISSRLVIAFSRTTSFGDLLNKWNKELLDMEDPDKDDSTKELEIRPEGRIIHLDKGFTGYAPVGFYGK
jgi:hypothetical protein